MTEKKDNYQLYREGIDAVRQQLEPIIRVPYALRSGVTLSTREIHRYDADLIITKDEVIIALIEVLGRVEKHPKATQIYSNTVKQLGCSFGIIYYAENSQMQILDVRDNELKPGESFKQIPSTEAFEKILYDSAEEKPTQDDWRQSVQTIIGIKELNLTSPERRALEKLRDAQIEYDYVKSRCYVGQGAESDFFKAILKPYEKDYICRYTTYASLERIIRERKQSVCSIVCMNDKSECYYVEDYFSKQNDDKINQILSANYEELNSCQISSCTDIQVMDKLSMWRMYGDNAKGVCLKFRVDRSLLNSRGFYLYYVDYAATEYEHAKLNLLSKLMDIKIKGYSFEFNSWHIWKHFFKSVHYEDEKEVRLLYFKKDGDEFKWIKTGDSQILAPVIEFKISKSENEFPLILSEIMLGPKFPEMNTNMVQILYWKKLQNIEEEKDCTVTPSKIRGYRG